MDSLYKRFSDKVNGLIKGFDRIVFKGFLRPIMFSAGMQLFLKTHGILNKDYKSFITSQSEKIIESANCYSKEHCGSEIRYISSCNIRKEDLVHEHQRKSGIKHGLVGIWSCVESCSTFRARYDASLKYPQIKSEQSRCKHLYFYFDHIDYGFMSVRLQTWAPYNIQIAINGREWLRRSLDKEGCSYIINGNKFLHIDDYALAQKLLEAQLDTKWCDMLNEFIPLVFPSMHNIFGDQMTYYWTMWQSEWAQDYIFDSPKELSSHIANILKYAFITGTSDRVLRYFGRPVKKDGQPHPLSKPELFTRVNLWQDGMRIRHWVDKNSVKLYNDQNVLRIEMTMNNPGKYLIYRNIQGDSSLSKKLLPMRKGISDVAIRAKVSDDRIKSFAEHISTIENKEPISDLISHVSQRKTSNGKSFRGLDITGKDLELLKAISDPIFDVDHITNKALQQILGAMSWSNGMKGKRLSSRISRHLRLLREHGIIKKVSRQHKYYLTAKGRKLTTAINVIMSVSIEDLLKTVA